MKRCEHVFILGFDGAGTAPALTDTPNLNRIFREGASTLAALTAIPTISAECWGTMLHGVTPKEHGLTNDIVSCRPYPSDSPYPSVFRLAREQHPKAELAAFSEWAPINSGIIEEGLGIHKESAHGRELAERASRYLEGHRPELLFFALDGPDEAGHSEGYFTEGHLAAVREADANLGLLLAAIETAGMWENSLMIVTTDHGGGGANPKSHGSDTPMDRTIYWGCRGPFIQRGVVIDGPVTVGDTAAMTAYALGLDAPSITDGKVIPGIMR